MHRVPAPRRRRRPTVLAAVTAVTSALVLGVAGTALAAPTPTPTPSPSGSPSPAPTTGAPSPTSSPTAPTGTPSPSATRPTPTATPTPTPTKPPKPTPTPTPTRPTTEVTAEFLPSGQDYVGVAYLLTLKLSEPIRAQSKRVLVERSLRLVSSATLPTGSWNWRDDATLVYRPRTWWPAHAKISVVSDLAGKVLGTRAGRTLVGSDELATRWTFRTGRAFIATVNAQTHRMRVRIDGTVVQDFPVSLGKPGFESRSGIKVYYGLREATHTYTSDSLGLTDESYVLTAPWNTRLTPTGEFVHAAPWAYGRLGVYNGSHGCTNMRIDDARWVYFNVRPGDVFVYTGTSKPMESWNGPFALWNIPWSQWKAGSARFS